MTRTRSSSVRNLAVSGKSCVSQKPMTAMTTVMIPSLRRQKGSVCFDSGKRRGGGRVKGGRGEGEERRGRGQERDSRGRRGRRDAHNENPSPSGVSSNVVHVASDGSGEESSERTGGGGGREERGGSESKLSSLVPATADSMRQLILPMQTREERADVDERREPCRQEKEIGTDERRELTRDSS